MTPDTAPSPRRKDKHPLPSVNAARGQSGRLLSHLRNAGPLGVENSIGDGEQSLRPTQAGRVQDAVTSILLEHPDVASAALLEEEGLDGLPYPVAYVVPNAARMAAQKRQVFMAGRAKRIAQWRATFNQTYRVSRQNIGPSFVGWNSSFTNKPIPEAEMRQWRDRTVERILSLEPDRVLEIGCGVGLLVDALAPKCRSYRGTDFSPVALDCLRAFVASRPDLGHVELLEREATNFDDVEPRSVDTVVLNSVAQYFPDLDYLSMVLKRAADAVGSGGRIFVGDVRHLGLLPVFHAATQLARAPAEATARWLKRKVSLAIEQERELVIDPQFFVALPDSIPRITDVEILLKRGPVMNELTAYRYDVVLHVGRAVPPASDQTLEWRAGCETSGDLIRRLEAAGQHAVRMTDVPNGRVARDLAAARLVNSTDDQDRVASLRTRVEQEERAGTDPEVFWQLSDSAAYAVRVAWSAHSREGRFDVVLADRKHWSAPPSVKRRVTGSPDRVAPILATDPLAAAFKQQLGLDLGKMLNERLPEPLLPAVVIAVNQDALPASA